MIGRRFVQRDIQKRPQCQRILRPPGDPSLGIDPFEIADQQQPKIDPWRQAGPPLLLRIKPPAQPLHKVIEMDSLQQLVNAGAKAATHWLLPLIPKGGPECANYFIDEAQTITS